jgi:hypothetical protein
MHYLATVVGIAGAVAAILTGTFWLFPLGIALGYVIAVLSHWVFEGNQPLILVNPFWGAVSDLRMCYLAATGQLKREAARHGMRSREDEGQGHVAPGMRDLPL